MGLGLGLGLCCAVLWTANATSKTKDRSEDECVFSLCVCVCVWCVLGDTQGPRRLLSPARSSSLLLHPHCCVLFSPFRIHMVWYGLISRPPPHFSPIFPLLLLLLRLGG
ncbi:uncharacterized protein K452DRAFT_103909 [Aplosporella prunicola CBS 121167]|uniref:Secreted protein n=1 Tax=Aplosporella prunicola CBS 121167 TaxID=1176127 RepID=A0A6A6BR81_9PEZI|nr:uncharacterized protein K452DRAFT_103909 [Aplosporella prunicola CBS 121167]KAF2145953.1 hypothetical protein K452DRAFT_103909 [Aplosporella prunicola CBS 121167]